MSCSNVFEDIEIAKHIIESNDDIYSFNECQFSDTSSLYRFSNEFIEGYAKFLNNREKVLSITASGDQILSSILFGTKEIDSIDISRFPKYLYELKKAAIKSLSLEEYIRFFVPEIENEESYRRIGNNYTNLLYKQMALKMFFNGIIQDFKDKKLLSDLYYAINSNLAGNYKIFWDDLLKSYNPASIYQSRLFKQENIEALYSIIVSNYYNAPYLKNEESYNKLKSKIDDCLVRHSQGDIFKVVDSLDRTYNLVNLSNIIDYSDLDEYKKLLDKFKLEKDGVILSYIYTVDDDIDKVFFDNKYKIEKLPTENIMIYKKTA